MRSTISSFTLFVTVSLLSASTLAASEELPLTAPMQNFSAAAGMVDRLEEAQALPPYFQLQLPPEQTARLHLDVPFDASVVINGFMIPGRARYRYYQLPANEPGTVTPIQVFPHGERQSDAEGAPSQTRSLRLFPGQLVALRMHPEPEQDSARSSDTDHCAGDEEADPPASAETESSDPAPEPATAEIPEPGAATPELNGSIKCPPTTEYVVKARVRFKNGANGEGDQKIHSFCWDDGPPDILINHPFAVPDDKFYPAKMSFEIWYSQAENPESREHRQLQCGSAEATVLVTEKVAVTKNSFFERIEDCVRKHLSLTDNAYHLLIKNVKLEVTGLPGAKAKADLEDPVLTVVLLQNQ